MGMTHEQILLLESVSRIAVTAAEQSGLAGYIEKSSQAKLDYATEYVQGYLTSRGLGDISIEQIRGAIEAAVRDMHSSPLYLTHTPKVE